MIQLITAPAGHGKTAYAIERIKQIQADDPLAPMWVILPNQAQVRALRQRLAKGSTGVLGVQLGTFYTFYAEILARAGRPSPRLLEPVQHRLLRHIVDRLCDDGRLVHYAPLRDKPGFVRVLREMIEELKRARAHPDALIPAVASLESRLPSGCSRLTELAALYAAYQDWLVQSDWTDAEGQGWLAAIELEREPILIVALRLLVVDGFDEFNPTQLAVLRLLAGHAKHTLVTLTGDLNRPERLAHRRFTRAQADIVAALNVQPTALPASSLSLCSAAGTEAAVSVSFPQPRSEHGSPLSHFESALFDPSPQKQRAGDDIIFTEAQNRAEEVRAALRWLKARIVRDKMCPSDVALIARDLAPYRPFIEEIATEYGLPLRIASGADLNTNPAIAALLSLLSLPVTDWPRRAVLDAWRSLYFEWRGASDAFALDAAKRGKERIPNPGSLAERLDAAARAGLVIQGLEQWREALDHLASAEPSHPALTERADDMAPLRAPRGQEAVALGDAFDAFVARLTPPSQARLRDYVAWVEELIGDDPKLAPRSPSSDVPDEHSLHVVANARAIESQPGGQATAERDVAALRAFKDVLRGLVLASSALEETNPISYARFFGELRAAVESATYRLPTPIHDALFVAPLLDVRGLSFRAVALLGLSEGDFPQAEREDTLLRESDRQALHKRGLKITPRLRGDEVTLFYQAVTRAREKLLLTRPYLSDDGQPWEPSPYWNQALRLFETQIQHIRPEDPLPPSDAASSVEWVLAGVTHPAVAEQLYRDDGPLGHDWLAVQSSASVLRARLMDEPTSPFEGDLSNLTDRLSVDYGPDHTWSSSRLEAYAACPFHFFAGQALKLEPHTPPQEGFDAFILGNIYHEILEKVYLRSPADPAAALDAVAAEVFDAAPTAFGFRPTTLWGYQQRELTQILARTIVALIEATQDYQPYTHEQAFGIKNKPPLVIRGEDGDTLRVRGLIDRVDRATDSGDLCIMDYKSGSTPIPARDLTEGKRVQLPLYALAARDALGLGQIADGFYWHIGSVIRPGRASYFRLEKASGGVQGAIDTAVAYAWATVRAVRAGVFAPRPPTKGCPGHCAAAAFCWRYVGRR